VPLALIVFAGEFTVRGWHARWHEFTDFLGGLGLAAMYAVVFGPLALLLASWLRRRMVAAAVIVGYVLLTSAVGQIVGQILGGSSGKAIGQVFGPPTLVLGLKEWIYQVHGTVASDRGPMYLIVTVAFIAATVGLLHLRYRKVSV
jgi:ABC-2 type transport system permease protein